MHDTLIREWGLLTQWLAVDHDFLTWLRDLESLYEQWQASIGERTEHDPGWLLRGGALDEALRWRRLRGSELADKFKEFIQLSEDAERQRRRDRRLLRGLMLVSVLLVGSTIYSVVQTMEVADERNSALSRQLAANAQDQLTGDPERSLLLAREAHKIRDTPEAEAALRQLTLDSPVRAVFRGHQGTVFGAAFSPDGQRVVSAGEDGTVRIWDASGAGVPVMLPGHQGAVFGVAFSPDGRRVVSAGDDGTVRIWDASGAGVPLVLRSSGVVLDVAFSADGQRVVSAGDDGTVRIWDASGAGVPVVLRGHTGRVYGVAFSPDRQQRVASASADGTVRVWDASGAEPPVVLSGNQGVYSVAFSPDGTRIVSGGKDTTVRIWDASGSGKPLELSGHDDAVLGVAFSSDGQRVVSASTDGTVRVWGGSGVGDPLVLRSHLSKVQGVAFSPDGKLVVSAGGDATVRVWDVSGAGAARPQDVTVEFGVTLTAEAGAVIAKTTGGCHLKVTLHWKHGDDTDR